MLPCLHWLIQPTIGNLIRVGGDDVVSAKQHALAEVVEQGGSCRIHTERSGRLNLSSGGPESKERENNNLIWYSDDY